MPDVDGLEATRMIRAREGQTRRVPIIALTANAMTADIEACRSAGMDDHVAKPYRSEELARMLEKWATPRPASIPAQRVSSPVPRLRATAPIGDDEVARIRARLCGLASSLGPDVVVRIEQAYLVEAQKQLSALEAAVIRRDAASVARIAHALKSSSGTVGAQQLSLACQELERLAVAGDWSEEVLGEVMAGLRATSDIVRGELGGQSSAEKLA